ncbi:MAG: type II toxin-antitoxin system VapC family toxin [Nitrospirae bacterium]|nr:type II toxin-antitoxin system VapC family toxin [Nitrospirota bacterium]
MSIFIDTSAFYALLDRDDTNNQKATKVWTRLLGAERALVTSNYVLVEAFALIQNRLGLEAVRGFQEDILPLITIEFITPEMHRSGIAALLSASRRSLSLVDCVSFELMRSSGIKTVFAFDTHFKEQGFVVLA